MREGMTKDSKFTLPSNPEAQARTAKLVDQMQPAGWDSRKGKACSNVRRPSASPLANLNEAQVFSKPQPLTPGHYLLKKRRKKRHFATHFALKLLVLQKLETRCILGGLDRMALLGYTTRRHSYKPSTFLDLKSQGYYSHSLLWFDCAASVSPLNNILRLWKGKVS